MLTTLLARTDFDVIRGTSVGAIGAAYTAASAELPDEGRATRLADTWRDLRLADVVRFSATDLLGVTLRALGLRQRVPRSRRGEGAETIGGLVGVAPLERIVAERTPLELPGDEPPGGRAVGALCVSCNEVRSRRSTGVSRRNSDRRATVGVRSECGSGGGGSRSGPRARVGGSSYVDGAD